MSTSEDNMFEVDLQEMDLEDLIDSTDRFTLMILSSLYTPEQIRKFDEANEARGIAFATCHRYMMAMKVLAERFTELESIKAALNTLI